MSKIPQPIPQPFCTFAQNITSHKMDIKPRFFLKNPTSSRPSLICLLFYLKGQRFVWSTGENILPIYWDSSTSRPITDKVNLTQIANDPAGKELTKELLKIKTRLDLIEGKTLQIIDHVSFQGVKLNLKTLKEQLKGEFSPDLVPTGGAKTMNLMEFIDHYILTSNYKYNTNKGYRTTYNVLKEYKKRKRVPLNFEDISIDFYNDFVRFCMEEGYMKNSIGGFIKHIKVFMNNAIDRGLTTNQSHLNRRFITLEEKVESIYLNEKELQDIANLDLSSHKTKDQVRDLFLIACYTGLRFGDLMQLRKENIYKTENGHVFKIRTQKTDEMVVIPIHHVILTILKKYDNDLPKPISDQKMNTQLKLIGEQAKIKERLRITRTIGGKNSTDDFFKYQLITIHTARRSFATNMYLRDVPSISIMKITGHKTEKAFLKYIKISPEENASKLMNHPFFQGQPAKSKQPEGKDSGTKGKASPKRKNTTSKTSEKK
ncbi:MAG: site-specific integrase [Bacteroidales bacterium]